MSAGGDEGVCGGGEGEPRPGGQLGCPCQWEEGEGKVLNMCSMYMCMGVHDACYAKTAFIVHGCTCQYLLYVNIQISETHKSQVLINNERAWCYTCT